MQKEQENNENLVNVKHSAFSHYRFAWGQLWKYFLELLLLTIISVLIELPGIDFSFDKTDLFASRFITIDLFIISFEGVGAYILFVSALYILFILPLEYGISFIHLRAIRSDQFKVTDMFQVFKNYWNAVFANLLVYTIIGLGMMFLIIPGIVFACKLSFVSYLIVDKNMDAVEAVKESWRMTNGYSWIIFFIGILAFFVFILGMIAFLVGAVVSVIWIRLTFASVYHQASKNIETNEFLING